jgi:hypothetical protein
MSANEKPNYESARGPEEDNAEQPARKMSGSEYPIPLFLRDVNEGRKGNAQDEKDEAGE